MCAALTAGSSAAHIDSSGKGKLNRSKFEVFSLDRKGCQQMYLSRARQGLTVFFTGLPGAGKSTIANALLARLSERCDRRVTLLDGDVVRKHLCPDLGFSKEDRDLNIRRVGFLASAITKSGGVAICALIAPYDEVRKEVRALVEGAGGTFLLVYVATPLAVCEQRDRKGLYANARSGALLHFTGISDPYETPSEAELVIDTTDISAEDAAQRVIDYLEQERDLAPGLELPEAKNIETSRIAGS